MKFDIKIVMNDNKEYVIEGLNEREAQEVLAGAYDDILALKEKVKFGEKLEVNALDLQCFYIK
jgi:hypothetical protein